MSVTTLVGNNAYGIEQEIKSLSATFLQTNDKLGIERINSEEADPEAVMSAILSAPLFTAKKLILIHDLSSNPELSAEIISLLDQPPETADIVIIDPGIDMRSKLYKALKTKTDFIDCTALKLPQLEQWVESYIKANSGNISRADAKYLVDLVGPDQLRLKQELDKLILFDQNVSKTSIDLLVAAGIESTTFNLADAVFSRHKAQALKLYSEQRQLEVDPAIIIGALAWQLHLLTLVKTAQGKSAEQIASETKLNPWSVSKAKQLAVQLSLQELTAAVDKLLQADIKIKKNYTDPDETLLYFLLSV
jgi:DNA polymerase-3 subunit delta